MKRHIIGRIVIGLVLIAALAGVGGLAYQAGLAQGTAVQLGAAGAAGAAVAPGMAWGWRGPLAFGLGFGLFGVFGLIFKIMLGFFLISLVLRLIFRPHWGWGRGPWMMHGHGPWSHGGPDQGQNVPPMFAEWHRRAHGTAPAADAPAAQPPAA